jgi:hypothetical protein
MIDTFQSANAEHNKLSSYHLWHFAAEKPDGSMHPFWNNSPALDSLTWETLSDELEKVSTSTRRCRTSHTYIFPIAQHQLFDESRSAFSRIRAVCPSAPIPSTFAPHNSHLFTRLIELKCTCDTMV